MCVSLPLCIPAYLQQLNAVCEDSGVGAGLAARGVDVTLDGVVRLPAGFIERAQVHPGGCVTVVQLHCTNVGLQCIHRLVLLLVQHTRGEREGKREVEREGKREGEKVRKNE